MRVVVVAEWYPSPADPVHGIWAHRQALATAAQDDVELRVLAMRRPLPSLALARRLARVPPDAAALRRWARGARESLRPATLDGLGVYPVAWLGPPRPISYGSWGYWMGPALARALDREYERRPFDVLHAHCLAPLGHAAARWVARRHPWRRPAFVVSGHGPDMIQVPERSPIGRRACVIALRTADLVLANSSWAQRRCERLAGAPVAVEVVHLGADVLAARERGRAVGGRPRLVTVAHLQARKHHDVVLRAMALMPPARCPDYLVIGDGECRESLERLAHSLGLGDRVRFLGQLPHPEAVARVADCDLFVMPSVEEPFGVAFVEAMAAGLPAVGGQGEGGPQDIAAAGEGMLLVEPGDAGALAEEIQRLTASTGELRRLGEAARATVAANFTWERCGRKTATAYLRAIDTGLQRRGAR
jgi:teichuronic acid biosynthesis glycosyltransferase TuaC